MIDLTNESYDLQKIAKTMTTFVGFGGMKVTTQHVSYGHVPVEAVLDGTANAVEVTATSDGRGYIPEWHSGAESGETAYVERYTTAGRTFHGFIDSVSRKIVQSG